MSGYNERPYSEQGNENYWNDQATQGQSSYNFDMAGNQFGQELNFQSFESAQSGGSQYVGTPLYPSNPYLDPNVGSSSYAGEIFTPAPTAAQHSYGEGTSEFDQEPPLLEGKVQDR
ncbi:uncharacterized protein [Anabrus simplex]|uniref:uncharacterized protein n=1 Tax=Anabrus simplex TaxID=316456 RepID=UPI0035A3B2C0